MRDGEPLPGSCPVDPGCGPVTLAEVAGKLETLAAAALRMSRQLLSVSDMPEAEAARLVPPGHVDDVNRWVHLAGHGLIRACERILGEVPGGGA